MANIVRDATPGDEWTLRELLAYNIEFVNRTKKEFFGTYQLPLPTQPSLAGFMTAATRANAQDDETRKLLHYLDLASDLSSGGEAAASIFLARLLERLEYDDGNRMVFIGPHELPFLVCGKLSVARTDLCVLDDDDEVILLAQGHTYANIAFEDDDLVNRGISEPSMIASAIAAFDTNNEIRQRHHLDPLPHTTFPAIVMIGTRPIFYKITITEELSTAVHTGTCPTIQTKVDKFVPALPQGGLSMAMKELENRTELLTCFNAFKQFLKSPQ